MFNFELERIPGNKNRADGLSRVNWDSVSQDSTEDTPPVDGFLDQEEDVRLHINEWALRVPNCVSHPIWIAPRGYERKADLVLKPFQEEDPWGGKDVQWMMKLALAGTHGLVEEVRAIEEGPTQVEEHEQLMGGMYLLTNMPVQGDFDQRNSLSPMESEDLVPESQDDEFEEGEIKKAFGAEEYDGIYLELGLLLSCEMRDRDASDKAQKMRHLYVLRDDHLFIKRQVGNPKWIVCGRNRQLDIIAALHDGIVGGHRGIGATCAKISELYHWDGMLSMVIKYCQSCVPCQERSAQRPGEPMHPRLETERPLRASGGGERHGPFRREPTPVFDDDNIDLSLDVYREHAAQRGWDVSERIHHLRGIGRFEEPIAQIREEALTWSEVEARMQRLRASPLGSDGLPIRLEEGNVEEFIPAYEQYMSDQGALRDEWVQALLIWTRGAERPLARQIRDRARDWEDCRAQLREAFRWPEPERPEPRIDRRRRSKRLRDLEARGPVKSRGGWKALAQREGGQAGPTRARESFPACGLRQVEFHPVTEDDLLGSSSQTPERRESEVLASPFRSLEAHLDASQWEAPSAGVSPTDPPGGEPTRPETEAEPLRLKGVGAEDVIMIDGDTPPGTPARVQMRQSWPKGFPKPDRQEAPMPLPEASMSPRQEVEARGSEERWRTEPRLVIDSRLVAHAAKHPNIEGPSLVGPSSGPAFAESGGGSQAAVGEVMEAITEKEPDEAARAKLAKIQARLVEIHERRDRMEAAGMVPTPPSDPKTGKERIDELWAKYETRGEAASRRPQEGGQARERASEVMEVGKLGFFAAREAIERVDGRVRQAATISFQRYSLLSDGSELALRKEEVEQLTTQLAEERAENKA
ncbi:hypothetical protein CBR_g41424 [Chara braunii]|uniref:Integrase zinc-binding domain-containing protein n=1 Tax=Chara braunii TaxID=69332 RepID=A0A388LVR7_CHABU|nr:hypothetical protein CBR_g41424 [Chara braunii]|eukprot:GBG86427.1 hypothetical protein CBR_g41424 [Chara braunii]